MVRELASLEKEERRGKKENYDFRFFFKISYLGFYKSELKSEDIIICTQEGQGFQ